MLQKLYDVNTLRVVVTEYMYWIELNVCDVINAYEILVEKLEGGDHPENQGIGGRIILQ